MGANPLAALNAINPSLVQYTGGWGKALQSIGGSMNNIGQAKLDLAQQERENTNKNAYLKLQQDMYDNSQKEKFDTKNETYAKNATTNAMLLGVDAPQEMSNEYARLSLIDPAITAAALKTEKDKYSLGANGLVINTSTGALAGDYRDKSEKLAKLPYADTMVKGVLTRNFINEDGKITSIAIPGTTQGVYSQYVSDSIGDTNTAQRPTIKNATDEKNGAVDVMQRGGMPVRLSDDPRLAAKQREWVLPAPGGGWYVPKEHAESYKRAFPR